MTKRGEPTEPPLCWARPVARCDVPNHGKIPFKREVFASAEMFENCGMHVAVHHVDLSGEDGRERYSRLHIHEVDEINLLVSLSLTRPLRYRFVVGSEEFELTGSHSVFIPAGTVHSADAVSGRGLFVCLVSQGSLR